MKTQNNLSIKNGKIIPLLQHTVVSVKKSKSETKKKQQIYNAKHVNNTTKLSISLLDVDICERLKVRL